MTAREIIAALKGRWHGQYGSARCPAHDDINPSLTIKDALDGGITVHCFAGCDWRDVKAELRRMGLLPEFDGDDSPCMPGEKRRAFREAQERERAEKSAWAKSIWNESQAAQGTPVEVYLKGRGINLLPPTIRYHGALKHADTGLYFPAMIGAVTRWPSRKVTGVHRTYLETNGRGKASVSNPKKMAGCRAGGAVRLAAAGERLGLAEGIETALSALLATDTPTWACLSASALKSVVIPDTVKEVFIFGDGDSSGIRDANEAAEHFVLAGKTVRMVTAPEGKDWNNVLMRSELREAACG